jgi:hypothetical protein
MITSKRGHKYTNEEAEAGKKRILGLIIKNWKNPVEFYIYDSDDVAMKLSNEFYLELLEAENLIKKYSFFNLPKNLKKPDKPEVPSDLAKWEDLEADSKYQKILKQYKEDLFVYNEEIKGQRVFIRMKKNYVNIAGVNKVYSTMNKKNEKATIYISESGVISTDVNGDLYKTRDDTPTILSLLFKYGSLNGNELAKKLEISAIDKTSIVSEKIQNINKRFFEKFNLGVFIQGDDSNRLIINYNGFQFNKEKYNIELKK